MCSLERFCRGDMLFSPLHRDFPSTALTPSLPHSLITLLYPALLLTTASFSDYPELASLVSLQQRLGVRCDVREVCEDVWVELVLSLSLAASCLVTSDLSTRTVLVRFT